MNTTQADPEFEITVRRAPWAFWFATVGSVALTGMTGALAMRLVAQAPISAILCGALALFLGLHVRRLWLGRSVSLVVTDQDISTTDGAVRISVSDMQAVQTGLFDYKPASGLSVRLSAPAPRYWQPGLIWVAGRRVGIGGMIPKSISKILAQTLAETIAKPK